MDRLADKVAIVTGGSQGISRSVAILFAQEGAKVMVADIATGGGMETVDIIRKNGGEATFVKTDVTNEEQVKELVNNSIETYGKIDVVFNGVGNWMIEYSLYESTPEPVITNLPTSIFDRMIDINLKSVFLMCKYSMAEMWKTGQGSIINVSSVAGIKPGPDGIVYSSAKAAVTILSDSLALHGSREGKHIRVNVVAPGNIDTPSGRLSIESEMTANWTRPEAYLKGQGKLGWLLPEDIAYCALFLASDESRMITGARIVVDGGGLGIP